MPSFADGHTKKQAFCEHKAQRKQYPYICTAKYTKLLSTTKLLCAYFGSNRPSEQWAFVFRVGLTENTTLKLKWMLLINRAVLTKCMTLSKRMALTKPTMLGKHIVVAKHMMRTDRVALT